MANQYLIRTDDSSVRAWAFIGILQGLEEMFRIKIPVLDVFGSNDWTVTMWGAPEREKQILRNPGSAQVIVKDATHFFERREPELVKILSDFLGNAFRATPP
jgi:pimeloyl-ACP methyl ester carboxylesterase